MCRRGGSLSVGVVSCCGDGLPARTAADSACSAAGHLRGRHPPADRELFGLLRRLDAAGRQETRRGVVRRRLRPEGASRRRVCAGKPPRLRPENCGGCCTAGVCRGGEKDRACGAAGAACSDCVATGRVCNAPGSYCAHFPPCGSATCPTGCCDAKGVCRTGRDRDWRRRPACATGRGRARAPAPAIAPLQCGQLRGCCDGTGGRTARPGRLRYSALCDNCPPGRLCEAGLHEGRDRPSYRGVQRSGRSCR